MLIINPGSISFPRGEYAKLGELLQLLMRSFERFIVDYYNREMEAVPELHCEFSRQK